MNKYTQKSNILTLYEYKNNSKFFLDYYDFNKIANDGLDVESYAFVTNGEWEIINAGHQMSKTGAEN